MDCIPLNQDCSTSCWGTHQQLVQITTAFEQFDNCLYNITFPSAHSTTKVHQQLFLSTQDEVLSDNSNSMFLLRVISYSQFINYVLQLFIDAQYLWGTLFYVDCVHTVIFQTDFGDITSRRHYI